MIKKTKFNIHNQSTPVEGTTIESIFSARSDDVARIKNLKIVLANLDPRPGIASATGSSRKSGRTLHFPMGLGIMANVLHRCGLSFKSYDSYVDGTSEGFIDFIKAERPEIIMMSGFLGNYSYKFTKIIAQKIRKVLPSVKIIMGGPMATTIPKLLVEKTEVDYVIPGEGEGTLIPLLAAIPDKKIIKTTENVWYKNEHNEVVYTGSRPRIQNLDDCIPLYDAFPIEPYVNFVKERDRCWEISSSRGCYASCGFCKLTFGQKITFQSLSSVIDHMQHIYEKYGIKKFNFVDDNFLNSRKHVRTFSELLLDHPIKFEWRFQGRADRVTPEIAETLVKVGLYEISFGIESFSQTIIDSMNKTFKIGKVYDNLVPVKKILKNRVYTSFIVGAPGENWKTVDETIQFIRKLKLPHVTCGILTAFPDTAFFDLAVERGLIPDEEKYCLDLGPVYTKPYVNLSDLTDQELYKARDLIEEAAHEAAYIHHSF